MDRFKRFLIPMALLLPVVIFGVALYFGWIGHRSMDWQEFRNEFALNEFQEVRFGRGKVTAIYRDKPGSPPLIVYPPSDPLPDVEQKWFIVKSVKHGIKITFEPTGESYGR